jgi:hypothetical protein
MFFLIRRPIENYGVLLDSYRQHGGKLIRYRWVWSVILFSSMQSAVVLVKPGEGKLKSGLPYTGRSLLLGLWGLPVGTVFSLVAIVINSLGGEDVTQAMSGPPPLPGEKQPFVKTDDKVIVAALGILILLIGVAVIVMLKFLK